MSAADDVLDQVVAQADVVATAPGCVDRVKQLLLEALRVDLLSVGQVEQALGLLFGVLRRVLRQRDGADVADKNRFAPDGDGPDVALFADFERPPEGVRDGRLSVLAEVELRADRHRPSGDQTT